MEPKTQFVRSFICPFIPSFLRSFVPSFIRSCTHAFNSNLDVISQLTSQLLAPAGIAVEQYGQLAKVITTLVVDVLVEPGMGVGHVDGRRGYKARVRANAGRGSGLG